MSYFKAKTFYVEEDRRLVYLKERRSYLFIFQKIQGKTPV